MCHMPKSVNKKMIHVNVAVTLTLLVSLGVAPAGAVTRSSSPEHNGALPLSVAAGVGSQVHTVQITIPAQFDFTLASLTLSGPAAGLRITTTSPTVVDYVAAAAEVANPRRIFVLVVNRQPRGSNIPESKSVGMSLQTRAGERSPELSEHVDVLADGAAGQDCSALTYYSALGHPYLYSSKLKPVLGGAAKPVEGSVGLGDAADTVADALIQACGDQIETTFERWVRQEPGPVHP
jgi:hypothetical protein